MKASRSIYKYKDRLVIKDYKQQESLDHFDIYFPVMRINFIRMILPITALHNFKIKKKIDVKITFLNGDLNKEIW